MPWLFVRAFGPAILTGTVVSVGSGALRISLLPSLAGVYSVQAIVTYSAPVPADLFPLSTHQLPAPYYEGYMLRDFPLDLIVDSSSIEANAYAQSDPCKVEDLTFLAPDAALWKRAFWAVNTVNSHLPFSIQHSRNVTLQGYQSGRHSLGFSASYRYGSGCALLDITSATATCAPQHKQQVIHVLMVGDSVMRLQYDYLVEHLDPQRFQISFVELYGGYWLCKRKTGPFITELLSYSAEAKDTVLLFNTGMHDIHRLCGHSFDEERPTYLNATELTLPCTTVYRNALRDALGILQQIPAAVRLFQTTHAAWPKFGNYGIAWDPRHAQTLPLDSAICERFNAIAVEEVMHANARANTAAEIYYMVDTYWMTLARPDNRETNAKMDIGKKLSHPGPEVVHYMVQVWWQAAMALLGGACGA